MKRIVLTLVLLFILAAPAQAADTTVVTLFESKAVAASGRYTTAALDAAAIEGYFGLQVEVRGNGTLTVGYQVSNDGNIWALPEGASAPLTGITKTSGPGSNGRVTEQFAPEFGRYIRFYILETGGSASVLVTVRLAYR